MVWVDFLLLGVKKLIQSYSGGKIKLRYAIVEPIIPRKKRRLIEFLVMFSGLIISTTICVLLFNHGSRVGTFLGLGGILFGVYISDLYLKKRLSGVLKKGEVLFEEDALTVLDEDGVSTATVPYKNIFRMTYKGNLLESYSSEYASFLSYVVKFRTDEGVLFTFELYKYPSLTESEKLIQRTKAPQLPKVLESTRPRYGIVEI